MSPRAIVEGAGLRGPGQEVFPDSAKQTVTNIVLFDNAAQVFRNEMTDDGGGDFKEAYVPHGITVAGRIDEIGKRGTSSGEIADQINEGITHIISLDKDTDVTSDDRVEIEGVMWTIMGEAVRTEQATIRLLVKELST